MHAYTYLFFVCIFIVQMSLGQILQNDVGLPNLALINGIKRPGFEPVLAASTTPKTASASVKPGVTPSPAMIVETETSPASVIGHMGLDRLNDLKTPVVFESPSGFTGPGGFGFPNLALQSGFGSPMAPYPNDPYSLVGSSGPGDAYGGVGSGDVIVEGELPVAGSTLVAGNVPVIGSVKFGGEVPAGGVITISGRCNCGVNGAVI